MEGTLIQIHMSVITNQNFLLLSHWLKVSWNMIKHDFVVLLSATLPSCKWWSGRRALLSFHSMFYFYVPTMLCSIHGFVRRNDNKLGLLKAYMLPMWLYLLLSSGSSKSEYIFIYSQKVALLKMIFLFIS